MSRDQPVIPARPAGVRSVLELPPADFPLHVHPEWSGSFPWLVQGTTGRGDGGLDMGLFGDVATGLAQARWRRLREVTRMPAAVHARQVHGAAVCWHDAGAPGLTILDAVDGHVTGAAGLLLTVSVADCVPVFVVAPLRRVVALLHGGWRGVAAGIVEAGIDMLAQRTAALPEQLHLHCGPAICGDCYEVGPEVTAALGVDLAGSGPQRVDLRAAIAHRALLAGIPPAHVTLSTHCTRCGAGSFWSHRGGCRQRQLAIAGVRG